MKKIILVLAFLAAGCVPNRELGPEPDIPEGLKDCRIYRYESALVLRCPNSTTSTKKVVSSGKSSVTHRSIVIDGVEYVEKDKNE
jgi:hypothetical protein